MNKLFEVSRGQEDHIALYDDGKLIAAVQSYQINGIGEIALDEDETKALFGAMIKFYKESGYLGREEMVMESAINIILDETDTQSPVFVEIENDHGRSIRIGERSEEGGAYKNTYNGGRHQ